MEKKLKTSELKYINILKSLVDENNLISIDKLSGYNISILYGYKGGKTGYFNSIKTELINKNILIKFNDEYYQLNTDYLQIDNLSQESNINISPKKKVSKTEENKISINNLSRFEFIYSNDGSTLKINNCIFKGKLNCYSYYDIVSGNEITIRFDENLATSTIFNCETNEVECVQLNDNRFLFISKYDMKKNSDIVYYDEKWNKFQINFDENDLNVKISHTIIKSYAKNIRIKNDLEDEIDKYLSENRESNE